MACCRMAFHDAGLQTQSPVRRFSVLADSHRLRTVTLWRQHHLQAILLFPLVKMFGNGWLKKRGVL
jgi:hypothetical protein